MIEVKRVVGGSLVELVRKGTVEVAAHWCNCFHLPDSKVYMELDQLTKGSVRLTDSLDSIKGNINKLGTYSGTIYTDGDVTVEIYNLYVSYSLPCPGMTTVHSVSVFDCLYRVISQMESDQFLAIPDLHDSVELDAILDTLASDYENELPDITILVVE